MLTKVFNEYKRGVIAYAAVALIAQSCLGSFAVVAVSYHNQGFVLMVHLCLITLFCMGYNVMVLSQQKPKVSFITLIASFIYSSAIIIYYMIVDLYL